MQTPDSAADNVSEGLSWLYPNQQGKQLDWTREETNEQGGFIEKTQ